jgi:tRNA (guanine37-N1)-methyltransferase
VGWDHGVHGTDRRRTIEAIAGTGPFRTIHHENGLVLEVDLERAYFSPRLAREHARVAEMIRSGERVFDLCCGIGPFSLLAARDGRASEVVAVDQNAEAIALLNRNRGRLRSRVPVETHVEDLGDFLSRATRADRAILNLPLEGIKYLTSVARVVSPAGALHFYDVSRRSESTERARVVLESLLAGSSAWTIEGSRRVHPYAPDMDLVAYDCRRLRQ